MKRSNRLLSMMLKGLSIPFLFLGGIGLAKELIPILTHGQEYEHIVKHPGTWLLWLLVAGALLGIGSLLWFISSKDKGN